MTEEEQIINQLPDNNVLKILNEESKGEDFDACKQQFKKMCKMKLRTWQSMPKELANFDIVKTIKDSVEYVRTRRIAKIGEKLPEILKNDPDYVYACKAFHCLASNNKRGEMFWAEWVTMDRMKAHEEAAEAMKRAYIRAGIPDGSYYFIDKDGTFQGWSYMKEINEIFKQEANA